MQLPKLGSIRTSKTGLVGDANIKRYTVSYEPTGRYYLSLQVETEVNQLPETHQSVGLDMGLADLVISSPLTLNPQDAIFFKASLCVLTPNFSGSIR